jgi:tRNA modification GTPase
VSKLRATRADTIAAIATPPGRGGIGVVRVSGKNLARFIDAITGKRLPAREACLRSFRGEAGEALDQGIALYYPAPRSYTGEDVLELQGHGGPAVLQLILERCLELGARLAEPGEFTRRAYLNDQIDLAQAESVADLIDAATSEAARSALRSLQGEFSREVQNLVRRLVDLRTLVEATLDFPEEEIDFLREADALGQLQAVQAQLDTVLKSAVQGRILRDGIAIALIGQPNVGKSSLLNRLAGEEVAIVTEVPGTTRDSIRQLINIDGVPVHVIDTAGLRETADAVELIGIARTWETVRVADTVILVIDSTIGLSAGDRRILEMLPADIGQIRVHNKIDLIDMAPHANGAEIWLSAKTGEGLQLLRHRLLQVAGWESPGEGVFLARARHLAALREAGEHLGQATGCWRQLELMAEELRLAQAALHSITGEFTADDLLGEIFSRFCLGK